MKFQKLLDGLLAHHPNCECYNSDVYSIKGVRVCKGCTLTITGLILSFLLFYLFGFYQNLVVNYYPIIETLLILPTVLNYLTSRSIIPTPRKLALGLAVGNIFTYYLDGISTFYKIGSFSAFLGIYIATYLLRQRESGNRLEACPHLHLE